MNIAWGNFNAGLQSVLDTALDAVVVMGDDGVIIGWNSSDTVKFNEDWNDSDHGRGLAAH